MTHKELASMAGVSPATVSKALHNSHEISDETAARILRLAEQTGYYEEQKKRRMADAKKSAPNLVILCCEIVSVFYAQAVSCLCREIEDLGGTAIVAIYDFDPEKLRSLAKKYAAMDGISGILCIPGGVELKGLAVPCVSVFCAAPGMDSVYIDHSTGLEEVISFLIQQGRTKIAYLGEPLSHPLGELLQKMLAEHGLQPALMQETGGRFEAAGLSGIRSLLRQQASFDAVVAAYDEIAVGAIHALHSRGIRVPEDVFVIGQNDTPSASHYSPPLSTICCSIEETCHMGLQLLLSRLYDPAVWAPRRVAIHSRLILRETTKSLA